MTDDERRAMEQREMRHYAENRIGFGEGPTLGESSRDAVARSRQEWIDRLQRLEQEELARHQAERSALTLEQAWGAALAESTEREAERERAIQRRADVREKYFRSIIPAHFWNASIRDYRGSGMDHEIGALLERVRRGGGLTIMGPVGTGKSHLAVALIREAVFGMGRHFKYLSMHEILNEYKAWFDRPKGEEGAEGPDYETLPDTLVIDDLWADRETDFVSETIHAIIGSRYERSLPTWVITNLPFDLVKPGYERAVSRILEMNGKPLEYKGPDRRRA